MIRKILDIVYDRWHSAGYGICLPAIGLTNRVVWADNVYFFAHFLEHVKAMAQDY